jgi:uncharacterized membrane protein YqjE
MALWLYLGRSQIALFSVSHEHQEQGAKARLLMFMAGEKVSFVAFRGITVFCIIDAIFFSDGYFREKP